MLVLSPGDAAQHPRKNGDVTSIRDGQAREFRHLSIRPHLALSCDSDQFVSNGINIHFDHVVPLFRRILAGAVQARALQSDLQSEHSPQVPPRHPLAVLVTDLRVHERQHRPAHRRVREVGAEVEAVRAVLAADIRDAPIQLVA